MSTDARLMADRTALRTLLRIHPDWTIQDFADALKRSTSWVQKWKGRIRSASEDDTVLRGQSRARLHPPPTFDQDVIDCVVSIRENPPDGLQRIPGPVTILAYLERFKSAFPTDVRLPKSSHTIWRILRDQGCLAGKDERKHRPVERSAPMSRWAIDFKQCIRTLDEEDGKKQNAVEALNIVDEGTSIVIDAHVRPDFTAETAIYVLIKTCERWGLPQFLVMDRDPRFVGSPSGFDFPAPLVRLLHNLMIHVLICPPRRPDKNAFVERYHRTLEYECLRVRRPRTLEEAKEVVAAFCDHYNDKRPNQAITCRNKPPREAYPNLPERRKLPEMIDPDHWIEVLDGTRFVRKVRANGTVSIDNQTYYVGTEKQGCFVAFRINGSKRTFVVEMNEETLKEIPIKGLMCSAMPFKDYITIIMREARTHIISGQLGGRQRVLPLETFDTSATGATTM